MKAALLHPFFRHVKIFQSTQENTIKRNAMIAQLIEELQVTSVLRQEFAASLNKCDENITIKTVPGLHEFLVDSSDDEEENTFDVSLFAQKKINMYMDDNQTDLSLSMLKHHVAVSHLFRKYNTVLRSSAASERLFSLAKNVLRMNRTRISDEHLEHQLLLKANRHWATLFGNDILP